MRNEPSWLTFDEVVRLNQRAVGRTKEPHGFINRGSAESALDSCRNRYLYDGSEDVIDLACIILMAFSRSQGFLQGNKRTGFLAAYLFLDRNGFALNMPDRREIAELVKAAIHDRRLEPAVWAILRAHIQPIQS